jgi:putative tryptophan/tyrosine transport system substrate-binding protein
MITRRSVALVACAAALVSQRRALANQPPRIKRVGWIASSAPVTPEVAVLWDAFHLELQRLGWTEGRDVVFERRFTEGVVDRLPRLVREVIERKVDLIVATGASALAAKQATETIPIVFVAVRDPVAEGLAASLARPSGNLTGLSSQSPELVGKRLQLLKETAPRIVRVAYLTNEAHADPALRHAAAVLGIKLLPAKAQRAEDLVAAFAAGKQADAWFVHDRSMHFAQRKTIVDLVAIQRKPAIYPHTAFTEAGGLMSYAVDLKDQFRRAAGYVDQVLRGAKPADLPVQQPTKFEFAINLKTAKALGLTFSQAVRMRADEVIQ